MAIGSDNVFPKIIGAEQGSDPATPAAGQRKLYAKAGGWYDIDDTGAVVGPFGTGSGGASGGILASTVYDPGTLAAYTTASTTLADVDATNLAVTFTAPPSGKVLIRLTATCQTSGDGATLDWSLRVGSTDAGSIWRVAATVNVEARSVPLTIAGLTPGTSYTYKWSYRRTDASGTNVTIYAGAGAGPATMEVHALP
jgi:hypothetical protein